MEDLVPVHKFPKVRRGPLRRFGAERYIISAEAGLSDANGFLITPS